MAPDSRVRKFSKHTVALLGLLLPIVVPMQIAHDLVLYGIEKIRQRYMDDCLVCPSPKPMMIRRDGTVHSMSQRKFRIILKRIYNPQN